MTVCATPAHLRFLALANAERAKTGLPPMALEARLQEAADRKARQLAETDTFGHGDAEGLRDSVGYEAPYESEIILYGQATPEAALAAWMGSPLHRAQIMNPNHRFIGVAGPEDEAWSFQGDVFLAWCCVLGSLGGEGVPPCDGAAAKNPPREKTLRPPKGEKRERREKRPEDGHGRNRANEPRDVGATRSGGGSAPPGDAGRDHGGDKRVPPPPRRSPGDAATGSRPRSGPSADEPRVLSGDQRDSGDGVPAATDGRAGALVGARGVGDRPLPGGIGTRSPLGAPTGIIPRGRIGGGGDWAAVNRFDPIFVAEGRKHGVPPAMLKAMMIVETGGKNVADPFGASGVMQIKGVYWGAAAKGLGYDLATDAGQIGMAAAILGGSVAGVRGATPEERFLATYYPIAGGLDTVGESGHTQRMYLDDIALYTRLIDAAHGQAGGTTGNGGPPVVKKPAQNVTAGGAGASPVATTSAWNPVLYGLGSDADAARFGLTVAERDRLVAKCYPGRLGKRPEIIVLHIQDGYTAGSLDWWANNVQASSTVMVQKDGSVLRVLPETAGPWTNGDDANPSAVGRALLARFGDDLNPVSLTVEAEGRPWDAMPEIQLRAIVWVVRDWLARYPWITRDQIIRHADLNSVSRPNCPGAYFPRVLAALDGGPVVPAAGRADPPKPATKLSKVALPEGVTEAQLAAWFGPSFDPDGIVTVLWAEESAKTGRFPELIDLDPPGSNPRDFYFDGGFLIRAENGKARVLRRDG